MSNDQSWQQAPQYAPPQPNPQLYFGPQHDEPPRKARRRGVPGWLTFVLVVVGSVFGFVAGVGVGSTGGTVTATQPATSSKAATKAAAAPAKAKAATIDGDGTYLVGSEVKPGTYKAPGSDACYWARLKSTDGSLESIIANNVQAGPQVVTIKSTDKAFQTTGCGAWTKAA